MPVSNRNKFVFVHVPKCAGTSVERYFQKFESLELCTHIKLSEEYIRQHDLNITGHVHGLDRHLAAQELSNILGKERYETMYRFTFVRNPYARLYSFYKFAQQLKRPDQSKLQVRLARGSSSFRDFLYEAAEEEGMSLFFNQWRYICDDSGQLLVDYVGKFETIAEGFGHVVDALDYRGNIPVLKKVWVKLGLLDDSLPFVNRSGDGDEHGYRKHYDDEMKEVAAKLMERDLSMFGYEF